MAFAAFQYIGDDGNTYQISQPSQYSAAGAGNLPPATGTELPFPGLYIPRYMHASGFGVVTGEEIRVVCDASNAAFVAGPGSTIIILGAGYKVTGIVGEQRARL